MFCNVVKGEKGEKMKKRENKKSMAGKVRLLSSGHNELETVKKHPR